MSDRRALSRTELLRNWEHRDRLKEQARSLTVKARGGEQKDADWRGPAHARGQHDRLSSFTATESDKARCAPKGGRVDQGFRASGTTRIAVTWLPRKHRPLVAPISRDWPVSCDADEWILGEHVAH